MVDPNRGLGEADRIEGPYRVWGAYQIENQFIFVFSAKSCTFQEKILFFQQNPPLIKIKCVFLAKSCTFQWMCRTVDAGTIGCIAGSDERVGMRWLRLGVRGFRLGGRVERKKDFFWKRFFVENFCQN